MECLSSLSGSYSQGACYSGKTVAVTADCHVIHPCLVAQTCLVLHRPVKPTHPSPTVPLSDLNLPMTLALFCYWSPRKDNMRGAFATLSCVLPSVTGKMWLVEGSLMEKSSVTAAIPDGLYDYLPLTEANSLCYGNCPWMPVWADLAMGVYTHLTSLWKLPGRGAWKKACLHSQVYE